MNLDVLELVKKQENYRDELYDILTDENYQKDDAKLLKLANILFDVNIITKQILDNGISEELYDLYSLLVININKEDYLKCQKIYNKILKYEQQETSNEDFNIK